METKTAWVIEDNDIFRMMVARCLTLNSAAVALGYNLTVRQFKTVDDALEAAKGLAPQDLPAFITTDGNTESHFSGPDLAEQMKGKKVGVLVISSEEDIGQNLEKRDCSAARFMKKDEFQAEELFRLIKESTTAALEQGGSTVPGQQSPYNGGRY